VALRLLRFLEVQVCFIRLAGHFGPLPALVVAYDECP
jgi:hypothetical protein